MRAWNVPGPGAQPRLSDLPVPELEAGTVLVKVKASVAAETRATPT